MGYKIIIFFKHMKNSKDFKIYLYLLFFKNNKDLENSANK